MTDLAALLDRVVSDLVDLDVAFALVGGLAVSVRTEPRFTRDVDLALAVQDDDHAKQIVQGLLGRGWTVDSTIEQEATERLSAVRLSRDGLRTGPVVDLLFASSGVEAELVAAAERLEVLPGTALAVARIGHLVALKLLSVVDERPQDEADLRALLAAVGPEDLDRARTAVDLILDRGYARGRDLLDDLARRTDSEPGRS